ncbi:hypothetical protein [Halobacillus litoralis]|uniref:Uncharacterized protein n=1 Tax=Halobacillus litoralis TaxID=45668 RepID=A0A410MJH9_9BACI|nr:hypothetical protein [Halobacillus litoralis]QAS54836.1 hypothetical protein HLI_21525 [Halobacillus litoralis]
MTNEEKIIALKSLNKGEKVTLKDGRVVSFERMKRTKWLGRIDRTLYDIPVQMFANVGETLSDEALLENAKKKQDIQSEFYEKKRKLKTLNPGDRIKLTNGDVIEFCKVNRKKFVGIEADGGMFNYPIALFNRLVETKPLNPRDEKIKGLAKKYRGRTIQTGWGPSDIGAITDDHKCVLLYEFGKEEYALSLENFLEEMHNNDLGKEI